MAVATEFTASGIQPQTREQDVRPSISVDSLWKVFGKNPERALLEEHRGKSRAEIQQELDLVVALRDVSFNVAPGETFVVMGLSGCGKSTLVRCLIRLIDKTSGSITVDGEDISQYDTNQLREFRRSKVAMVFQNYGLLPHKNVLDNAAYGLEVRGMNKQERHAVAAEMLEKVGLEGWEQAKQSELSGGMQQRVGLARALAVDPAILLMDEPFSGLDPLIRRQMREELAVLEQEIQKTIVFITHDLEEAITVGDRIVIMRDGEVIQMGTPKEIITSPADDFVREFTQGIPRTKVMDISSIVSEPEVICRGTDSVEMVRAKLDHARSDYAIGLGDGAGFVGVICRERLDAMRRSGSTDFEDMVDDRITPVHPDTTLEDALPKLADDDAPLPVVDDENNFIGVATPKDMLQAVASGM